jgi:hypothetical protein
MAMRSVSVLHVTRRAPGRGRGSPLSLTALAHLPSRVFTSLSPAARLRASTRVDSSQAIRVSKAARAVPRSGGGCAVPGLPPGLAQRRCRNGKAANRRRPGGDSGSSGRSWPGHPSGGCRDISPERAPRCGTSSGSCPHGARFPCVCALFRPRAGPERGPPRSSPRRRTAPESSCGTPMHAASLTKGYGGNPPSGRSVSPPRTGPFFLGPPGGSNHRPEPFIPPRLAAHRRSGGRLRPRGLPHGQGPPAATTGPHIAACPILTEGLTIT